MKRWDSEFLVEMSESEDGYWIMYEDAADLQRQLAEANSGLEYWRQKAITAAEQLTEVTRERDTLKAMVDLQNLRAERANLGSGK